MAAMAAVAELLCRPLTMRCPASLLHALGRRADSQPRTCAVCRHAPAWLGAARPTCCTGGRKRRTVIRCHGTGEAAEGMWLGLIGSSAPCGRVVSGWSADASACGRRAKARLAFLCESWSGLLRPGRANITHARARAHKHTHNHISYGGAIGCDADSLLIGRLGTRTRLSI